MSGFIEEDYTKRFDWSIWRRVLKRTLNYRRFVIPLASVACFVGGVDTGFNLVTKHVIDKIQAQGREAVLWPQALQYAALALSIALAVYFFIRLAGNLSTGMSHDIRRDCFERLQSLSFAYYDKHPVGWLMARMTSDARRLSDIIAWGCIDLVWGTAVMVCIAAVLFWMDWRLALATLAVIPLLAWASLFFQKKILATSRLVRKTNSRLTATYNEGINGVCATKVTTRETENLREFQELSTEMYNASVRNAVQSAVYMPIVLTLSSLGVAMALHFGGLRTAGGAISLGTLVAFVAYARQFFDPIREMSRIFMELQHAQASAERIFGLLDTEPEIKDSPEVIAAIEAWRSGSTAEGGCATQLPTAEASRSRLPGGTMDPPRQGGPTEGGGATQTGTEQATAQDGLPDCLKTITFENVGFHYQEGKPVLREFALEVTAGQRIALVGPTGGGKTTIVNLLCRFYEPTEGRILLDGIDYKRRSLSWLQSKLGIVLQTPHLFSGTIRENIRYGRLEASDEEVERAARLVDAHEFIMSLPEDYESRVDKEGGNLSTGQKQLLSFARAVLADPWIFVMDEATSSIDTATEQRVQRALEAVLHGRTSFIIAHRLSTIRSADLILVVDGGKVVESGTHRELIRRQGFYYELYTQQFHQEKEEHVLSEALPGETVAVV